MFKLVALLFATASCADCWTYSALQEKYTLIDFQQTASTTTTSAWDTLWDHSTQPCSGRWDGVRCNAHGYVSHLFLGGRNLNGKLFDKFFYFRDLEQIHFGNNFISNELPASIGSLSHLTTLDLSGNKFVGTIPASWGSLTNLQRLILRDNTELTGTVPEALELLDHIRFDIDGTQLEKTVVGQGGSSGNSGQAPYAASKSEYGAASTYPHQNRRVTGVSRSLYHSNL